MGRPLGPYPDRHTWGGSGPSPQAWHKCCSAGSSHSARRHQTSAWERAAMAPRPSISQDTHITPAVAGLQDLE